MGVRSDYFWVRVENSDAAARLRLIGRMDSVALSYLEDKIAEAQGRDVVLDLEGVTFVDDSAYLAVLASDRRVRRWGRQLRLEKATGTVLAMFQSDETKHLLPPAARP